MKDDVQPADYIDQLARGEFIRVGLGVLLVSFMTAHATLFSIIFARNGHDLHDIGVILSSAALPIIFFSLISSEFCTRIGVLPTLRLAMVLCIIGFASFYFTRASFTGAIVSRIVQGAGQGLFLSAAITYGQSRLTPNRLLYLLGVFSAMMPLSQALGPPFGEWSLARFGENAMIAIAVVPGLMGLALTFGVRPIPSPPRAGGLDLVASWRKELVLPLVSVASAGSLFGFAVAYLAPALEARHIPIAAFFTASTLTMFATRFLGLRRVEAVDRRFLVAAGLMLEAIGYVAVSGAGSRAWMVSIGGVLFGFGHSMIYPVLAVWVTDGVDAARRAGPQAWLNAFFNLGIYATPLPETWLVAAYGYEAAMVALAAIAAAVAIWLAARATLSRL
ncbi:MAG: MFS transporter [Hyphomicrobiales bacterium]|nr:MFS transporter [Rhodoblastus sp.]MCB9999569.1 MFS transporter [Methylobacteriaceae bacterium]MCC2099955.1 MFS transporter [Hyphomicrobiales bacterium]HRY03462.1 MFS transporter [Beijerinckiaceae bacterium]MCC2102577.1 MFS transporter [Hyphomicrobiales bacterium]